MSTPVADRPDPGIVSTGWPLPSAAAIVLALGWLTLATAVASHFGWWILPAGIGLFAFAAAGAHLLSELAGSLVEAAGVYSASTADSEGSDQSLAQAPAPRRLRR